MSFLRAVASGENRFVLRLALTAAVGGFLFGYDTGIISGAILFIGRDLGASQFDKQAFVGSLLVGAVLGAILSGFSANALSRRRTKIISGMVYVVGALGSALSQTSTELIIARFEIGSLIFFMARPPETKGRSLEEISKELGADPEAA